MPSHTFSADGSATFRVQGPIYLSVPTESDFGGGTLQVKYIGTDGNEKTMTDDAYTAAFDRVFDFPNDDYYMKMVLTLSGATSPDLYVHIEGRAQAE